MYTSLLKVDLFWNSVANIRKAIMCFEIFLMIGVIVHIYVVTNLIGLLSRGVWTAILIGW